MLGWENPQGNPQMSQAITDFVASLAAKVPKTRTLTDKTELDDILAMATEILNSGLPIDALARTIYDAEPCSPANLICAMKSAESYQQLQSCPPCHLTVLFAMYHEQNRIAPAAEGTNGQDFIRNKVKELKWLFSANKECTWDLVGCDDGCDKDSGKLANEIIKADGLQHSVRVLFLQDCIDKGIEQFSAIKKVQDSRKGGSILYGMYDAWKNTQALANGKPHYLIYTDADLSASLSLSGFLLKKCLKDNYCFSMGARYGYKDSFLVKETGAAGHPQSHFEQPNVIHIKVRHFFRQYLLPTIAHLYDTNIPFKCWKVDDFGALLPECNIYGPAFDMQLLLSALRYYCKTTGKDAKQVAGVHPIIFIEDFAESNFTSNETNPDATSIGFLRIAQEIAQMHQQYKTEDATGKAKAVLEFIPTLDLPKYKAMIAGIEAKRGRKLSFEADFEVSELEEAIAA
eukprot:TRINITY_DN66783_c7_g1_i1.p1 TRINITY_DN66783_c7_g1~~TRINITY_DN66783_c7_g1_i1.p1  ORF type:complete len:458 (-),score=22.28 TRINITY_DN66783_c7_g1_i1:47-1420(-)